VVPIGAVSKSKDIKPIDHDVKVAVDELAFLVADLGIGSAFTLVRPSRRG
jgi:hypothetical protein